MRLSYPASLRCTTNLCYLLRPAAVQKLADNTSSKPRFFVRLHTIMDNRGISPLRPPATLFRPEEPSAPIHPVIHAGRVAVITGASSGIGKAAALELAKEGLRIALADVNKEQLEEVSAEVAQIVGEQNVITLATDVSKFEEVQRLKDKVFEQWGEVSVLMNNAGIGIRGTTWEGLDNWKKLFDVNVFGVIHVNQAFVPVMMNQENQSMVIITGSKQGITNPPGNSAYNATKAAVKSITQSLAHELRQAVNSKVTAHLFVPGWTHTGMTGGGGRTEKPPGAWSAQETVLYMLDKVRLGDFYIICPDNETRREVDGLRILWEAGDIVENRPALSRWHPAYKGLFEEYMNEGLNAMQ